jgi:hypothetical protein
VLVFSEAIVLELCFFCDYHITFARSRNIATMTVAFCRDVRYLDARCFTKGFWRDEKALWGGHRATSGFSFAETIRANASQTKEE